MFATIFPFLIIKIGLKLAIHVGFKFMHLHIITAARTPVITISDIFLPYLCALM